MVKRRSFKDIDISKDFEKRLAQKTFEQEKESLELRKTPLENMSLQELEIFNENQMNKLEAEKELDTSTKLIFEDVK